LAQANKEQSMKAFHVIVLAATALIAVARNGRSDDVPSPEPILTRETLEQARAVTEWVFGRKLTGVLRETHDRQLAGAWNQMPADARRQYLQLLEQALSAGQLNKIDQEWLRTTWRPSLLLWLCALEDPSLFNSLVADQKGRVARPATADLEQPLVPGTPLTRRVVERATQFVEWLFDLKLSRTQVSLLTQLLIEEAQGGDERAIQGTLELARLADRVMRLGKIDKELARAAYLPGYAAALEGAEDPIDLWLLRLYQSRFPVLVDGQPTLTRFSSDAHAELYCFLVNQVAGKEALTPDRTFKDDYANWLAGVYSQADAAEREQWLAGPLMWASIKVQWSNLAEPERQAMRTQWSPQYSLAARANSGNGSGSFDLHAALRQADRIVRDGREMRSRDSSQPARANSGRDSDPYGRLADEMRDSAIRHTMMMNLLNSMRPQ
jgi:hypothetical protein